MNKKRINKIIIATILFLVIAIGTILVCGTFEEKAEKIPILTFHRIVSDEVKKQKYANDEWVASATVFEEQMKYLYENGYKTISMDEFYDWYQKKCEFPKKTVMLTLDDGDLEDYYIVMPILKKYNLKATSFIVGSRAKEERDEFDPNVRKYISKDIIKDAEKDYPYLEYQSHTYNLHRRDSEGGEILWSCTREEIFEDFEKNKEFGFEYLAYPYGAYNQDMMDALEENEYKLAFTFKKKGYATRKHNKYEIPRIKINGFADLDYMIDWLEY